MNIRDERPGDEPAIFAVNEAAFGRPDEARLVDALRNAGAAIVSLVAEVDGEIVGHILFSEVKLDPPRPVIDMVGLGAGRGTARSAARRHRLGIDRGGAAALRQARIRRGGAARPSVVLPALRLPAGASLRSAL